MDKKFVFLLLLSVLVSCAEAPKRLKSPLFDNPQPLPADLSKVKLIPQNTAFELQSERRETEAKQQEAILAVVVKKEKTRAATSKATAANSNIKNIDADTESDFIIYTARGGEKLKHLARSLLGSLRKESLIKKWNPQQKQEILTAGQSLKIRKDSLKPLPMFLTKEIVLQYPTDLAKAIHRSKKPKLHVTKAKETLQKISKQHYVTTRRWTEIYLLNFDKIKNPDNLEVGIKLNLN